MLYLYSVGGFMTNINEKAITKKKINIKKIILDFFEYYKKNLLKKHIICFIIMIIIFILSLNLFYTNLNNEEIKQLVTDNFKETGFLKILGENVFLTFIIIFAGFTPYIYLSVIGLFFSYNLANNIIISYIYYSSTSGLIFMIIGGVIQIIGISLSVATGINYCSITTKRKKFTSNSTFGINDIKKTFYNIRNNEDGIKKVEESNKKKIKEKQKYNIKVPYLMFLISFLISIIFIIIGIIF